MISFCKDNESFIQVQQTALFYATRDSESKDDVLDVLQYLFDEKGINVNLVDEVILARFSSAPTLYFDLCRRDEMLCITLHRYRLSNQLLIY